MKTRKYTIGSVFTHNETKETIKVIGYKDEHYFFDYQIAISSKDSESKEEPFNTYQSEDFLNDECTPSHWEPFTIGDQIDTLKSDAADSLAPSAKENFEFSQQATPSDLNQGVKINTRKYKVGDVLVRKWDPVNIILKEDLGDDRFNAHEVGNSKKTCSGIHSDTLDLHFDLIEAKQPDNVNHPSHYTQGGIETIDFIEAKLTREELIGAYKFQIIKYSSRSTLKNGEEDLRKMQYYSNRLVQLLEKK